MNDNERIALAIGFKEAGHDQGATTYALPGKRESRVFIPNWSKNPGACAEYLLPWLEAEVRSWRGSNDMDIVMLPGCGWQATAQNAWFGELERFHIDMGDTFAQAITKLVLELLDEKEKTEVQA